MSNLITLARARYCVPNIATADEPAANALIAAASAAIERHCRRVFPVTVHEEIRDGGDGGPWSMLLDHWPIVELLRVASARRAGLTIVNNDRTTNQRAAARMAETALVLIRGAGATTVQEQLDFDDHPTLGELATAVAALGFGWSAAVEAGRSGWPSADLRPLSAARGCLGRAAAFDLFEDDLSTVAVETETGRLWGPFPAGRGVLRIVYRAGFDPIPDDLQQACCLLVAAWFAEGRKDSAVHRERLGDYNYTRAAQEGLPEAVRRLLAPYRRMM